MNYNAFVNIVASLVAATALGACASTQTARFSDGTADTSTSVAGHEEARQHQTTAGMCPMEVQGTTAAVEAPEGATAILFTTSGDVAELRRRVEHMAQMHNRHHSGGHGMHGAGHDENSEHSGMREEMRPPASTARAEDVEGGARLFLTPEAPGDLESLREHVANHVARMTSGECPMMSSMQHLDGAAPNNEDAEHEEHGDHE